MLPSNMYIEIQRSVEGPDLTLNHIDKPSNHARLVRGVDVLERFSVDMSVNIPPANGGYVRTGKTTTRSSSPSTTIAR